MPKHRIIERDLLIPAAADDIRGYIMDLRSWQQWSPWEGLDPDLRREYSGPESGVGAVYRWSGNRKAGAGVMTVQSVSDSTVDIEVEFTKPFKSTSLSRFELQPLADSTQVTWQMLMPNTLATRMLNSVMKFDKAIGADLEKGLDGLSDVVR